MLKIYLAYICYLSKRNYCKMIRHFFLDKTNSIVESSQQNMGLNPVLYLGYGNRIMRGLIHFDTCKIKELIDDKTFANIDKLKFTLKMTNCFSLDGVPYEKTLIHNFETPAKRAASFNLILFKLPKEFDEGRGFDYTSDFWITDKASLSKEGSNWFFAKTAIPWTDPDEQSADGSFVLPKIFRKDKFIKIYNKLVEYSKELNEDEKSITCEEIIEDIKDIVDDKVLNEKSLKGGIYTLDYLKSEYENFINGKPSIIIAEQHFDFGDEMLSMDITDYVIDAIRSGVNNGLCLAFAPNYEEKNCPQQYVGFVNNHTNTFFHPYVEAKYEEYINDSRESFTIGKKNSLYLYVFDDGEAVNLDRIPTCSIEDSECSVKQVTKGVYCAEFDTNGAEMEDGAIYYDTWSEIELNGQKEDDVTMEFATKPKSFKTMVGSSSDVKTNMVPSLYGINDEESVNRGEIREVTVDFRKEYETDKRYLVDGAEYRLYVKDGNREITVIDYQPVEKSFLNNFFIVYTEDLIPNKYYVDIKTKIGRETKFFKGALRFKVVSDITERYQ